MSFLRYYIRHLPYGEWLDIQSSLPELSGFEASRAREFDFRESFGYASGAHDTDVSYFLTLADVVVEHHEPSRVRSSQLWTGDGKMPMSLIDDILVLSSIAKNRHVHAVAREYIEDKSGSFRTYPTVALSASQRVIAVADFEGFLTTALSQLQVPTWTDSSGFAPAIHWYYQTQSMAGGAPGILQLAMYWVTLEVLEQARGFGGKKKSKVRQMVTAQGFRDSNWRFLDDALSDWYRARNYMFHEGRQPNWDSAKLQGRLDQIAEFTSALLADACVPRASGWKSQLGVTLQRHVV